MGDGFIDGARATDRDALGISESKAGDRFNFWRHGGGKEQRLPFAWRQIDDFFNVIDEAHIQHPVYFIENEDF